MSLIGTCLRTILHLVGHSEQDGGRNEGATTRWSAYIVHTWRHLRPEFPSPGEGISHGISLAEPLGMPTRSSDAAELAWRRGCIFRSGEHVRNYMSSASETQSRRTELTVVNTIASYVSTTPYLIVSGQRWAQVGMALPGTRSPHRSTSHSNPLERQTQLLSLEALFGAEKRDVPIVSSRLDNFVAPMTGATTPGFERIHAIAI